MTYLILYIASLLSLWWIYRVGWVEALKTIISVLVPSILIVLVNVKAGRLIFKSPILGVISVLPTTLLIYRGSQPLVSVINSWIDSHTTESTGSADVVDAEVISKEDF